MKYITGTKSKVMPLWTAVLIGILFSLLVSFTGALIKTLLINKGSLQENTNGVLSAVIWFASTFVGSVIACKIVNRQYFVVSVITFSGYLLFLVGMQIIFFDSKFYQIWKGVLAAAVGIIPCILMFARTSGRKKAKIKYRPV